MVKRRNTEEIQDKPTIYHFTREDLLKAVCTQAEPCGAHVKSVDQMIRRIERFHG